MFLYGGAVSDNSWNRYREQSIRRSNKTGYFRHFQNEQAATAAQNGNALQRLIRIFADIFVPIIPVMVATGLFMGLRGLLTQDALLAFFGTSSDAIPQQFLQFTQILTDTAFSFASTCLLVGI